MSVPLKISGFIDYSERENRLFSAWKKKIEDIYSLYGFMNFNARPVETAAALTLKGGIAHQIYTLSRLTDGGLTELALPFDRTVPLAIYIAQHRHELVYPFKRFDISHSFRGERAQAGRFRGFIQADLDVIEEKLSVFSEIECLLALEQSLKALSIPPFTIFLNHIDIPKYLIQEMGVPGELMPEALRIVDKMDKIGRKEVERELAQLQSSLDFSNLELMSFKGSIEDFSRQFASRLNDLPGFSYLQKLLSLLDSKSFAFNPGMVRGLDYYTGIVCETTLDDYAHFGSISSGGRYNKLVDAIINTESRLEGFGISIGLTRLFDIVKREKLLPDFKHPAANVAVAFREASLHENALLVAKALRKEHMSADLCSGDKISIGKQIAYADKKDIPYVFMLMGSSYVIKNLATGEQSEDIKSLDEAILELKALLGNKHD